MIITRSLKGHEIQTALTDLARLRIKVFRDWPYLYDGDLAYEEAYLKPYRDSARAIVVGAFDGAALVGAATGTPLSDHAAGFQIVAENLPAPIEQVFYCAESVLLPEYRGQGIGHAFFDLREAHARNLGFSHALFCGVTRPASHPLRPAGYQPLDPFWRKRGYAPLDGVSARFSWKDLDQPVETEKPLQVWLRQL